MLSVSSENWQGTIDAVDRAGLPIVLIDRELAVQTLSSAVFNQHDIGAAAAVRDLAAHGHRRIALVNGPNDVRPARERASTMRKVARELSMTCTVRSGEFTAEHGQHATEGLLAQAERPTAIIAGSNQILPGVLRAIQRAGVRIPQDVSLVTCDEVALAEFLIPPLATIRRDNYEIGRVAGTLMLELLTGAKPRVQTLPTDYLPAASVGPAPAN
jgi:LacI family transcriptional regulator